MEPILGEFPVRYQFFQPQLSIKLLSEKMDPSVKGSFADTHTRKLQIVFDCSIFKPFDN